MKSTLYIRIVPQDKDRGYQLLVGFDPALVQRTAVQLTTLSVISRASINAAVDSAKQHYNAVEVKDLTASALQKKLAKLFGEEIAVKAKDGV
jgi:hypothetical protein